jgi:hypothetical protein
MAYRNCNFQWHVYLLELQRPDILVPFYVTFLSQAWFSSARIMYVTSSLPYRSVARTDYYRLTGTSSPNTTMSHEWRKHPLYLAYGIGVSISSLLVTVHTELEQSMTENLAVDSLRL